VSETYDALIVGASVAGAATAIHLGRRGRRVLLLDRACFPREKPCGEGLMPQGAAALRALGLLDELVAAGARRFAGIRYHAGPGAVAEGAFPEVAGERLGLAVRRLALDAALLGLARRTPGVEVREGARASGPLLEAGRAAGARLEGGEEVRARVLVAADGNRSALRRQLGLEARSPLRPRFGVTCHLAHAAHPPGERLFVDVILARGGEVYVTPVGPEVTLVAILLEREAMRGFAGRLDAAFREALRASDALPRALREAEPIGPARAIGPLGSRARRVVADGALLVGDAAGFLDAITGEGMSIALASAPVAAAAIDHALARGDVSARALAPYARFRARAVRDQERLTRMILALAARPRLARAAIALLARRPRLFTKLLGVNCGAWGLAALRPWDLRAGP
jgi:flavin-dependent dehydrogenase